MGMNAILLFATFACLVGLALPGVSGAPGFTFSSALEPKQRDWMSRIDDKSQLFVDVTMPGTHDSASNYLPGEWIHQCQSAGVMAQLNAGVRFLDLRLAFVNGVLHLTHGMPAIGSVPRFSNVMGEVYFFLSQNPSEVIVARIRKEFDDNLLFTWYPENVTAEFKFFDSIIDRKCRSLNCAVGPSRGKVIFLDDNVGAPGLDFMWYNSVLAIKQDVYTMNTNFDLYSKWEKARSLLISTSTQRRRVGAVNYFSGSTGSFPYFVASGQSDPNTGLSLWTGVSKACWDNPWSVYPDFPRKDCTFCGNITVCSIHFSGTNNMLYDWLYRGNRGEAQSREVEYVWPQKLGILALDFPDNAVLDEIIAVNFVKSNPYKGIPLIPKVCDIPCPSCVAGDTKITTSARGVVAARDVKVGDSIPGMKDGEWCEVVAAVRSKENGTAFGSFTGDHLIVDEVLGVTGATTYVVTSNGNAAPARQVDLVNIATKCPAARAISGELFTPLSTVFCEKLTWDQYIPLYSAILRIVSKTGGFWFDPSIYVSDASNWASLVNSSSDKRTPRPNDWAKELPGVCSVMLSCVVDGEHCPEFEHLAAHWVKSHVPPKQYAMVLESYPNIGQPDATHGNLSGDVRKSKSWLIIIIASSVVGSVVLGVALGVAIYLCKRRASRKAQTKPAESAPM